MLKIKTLRDVYEPAEDSFLLAKHAKKLNGRILEVGCGCGIVSLECAFSNQKNIVEGVDINRKAVALAKENAKENKIKNARFYYSNLFSKVKGKFDWIVFNPPYLPTAKEEKIRGKINLAFDGGRSGLEIIEKFARGALRHLKKNGGLLVIASSLAAEGNGIEEAVRMLNKNGFKVDVIEEQSFFFERIALLRAMRS